VYDQLARSTRDLLNILDKIRKAGASFRSLADTCADTTTAHGRLLVTVLAGIAEFERSLISARTGEGRKQAKARGVHLGRPQKLSRFQSEQARKMQAEGKSNTEIGRLFGVSHQTIGRL
jgi:DNA invertase Pin-like site-specific DNA recombinase